jgi:hypothetical protein
VFLEEQLQLISQMQPSAPYELPELQHHHTSTHMVIKLQQYSNRSTMKSANLRSKTINNPALLSVSLLALSFSHSPILLSCPQVPSALCPVGACRQGGLHLQAVEGGVPGSLLGRGHRGMEPSHRKPLPKHYQLPCLTREKNEL